jgi:hypothetical protein
MASAVLGAPQQRFCRRHFGLYIVNVILRETLVISVAGIILGVAVSFLTRSALRHKFQTMPILITPEWLMRGHHHRRCRVRAGVALRARQQPPRKSEVFTRSSTPGFMPSCHGRKLYSRA